MELSRAGSEQTPLPLSSSEWRGGAKYDEKIRCSAEGMQIACRVKSCYHTGTTLLNAIAIFTTSRAIFIARPFGFFSLSATA